MLHQFTFIFFLNIKVKQVSPIPVKAIETILSSCTCGLLGGIPFHDVTCCSGITSHWDLVSIAVTCGTSVNDRNTIMLNLL